MKLRNIVLSHDIPLQLVVQFFPRRKKGDIGSLDAAADVQQINWTQPPPPLAQCSPFLCGFFRKSWQNKWLAPPFGNPDLRSNIYNIMDTICVLKFNLSQDNPIWWRILNVPSLAKTPCCLCPRKSLCYLNLWLQLGYCVISCHNQLWERQNNRVIRSQ